MMLDTTLDIQLDSVIMSDYFNNLVNRFFKILPMRENNEESLSVYICSLQRELLGAANVFPDISNKSLFINLIGILQFLVDSPDCPLDEVRREVFSSISTCKRLSKMYGMEEK